MLGHLLVILGVQLGHGAFGEVAAFGADLPLVVGFNQDRAGKATLAISLCARQDRSGSTWRLAMALRIVCMCGCVIQGGDDEELWRSVQEHMGVLHPELVDNVTREDLLAQAELL